MQAGGAQERVNWTITKTPRAASACQSLMHVFTQCYTQGMPPGPKSHLSDLPSTPLITAGRKEMAHYAASKVLSVLSSANYRSCPAAAFSIPSLLKSVIQEREQNFLTGVFTCGQHRLAIKLHSVSIKCCSKANFPRDVVFYCAVSGSVPSLSRGERFEGLLLFCNIISKALSPLSP